MGEYYPSSQHYKMNMDRLIETSTPGDKFYLVICSNKIIQVYNTKFFEINDNTYAPNSTKFIWILNQSISSIECVPKYDSDSEITSSGLFW